MVRGGGSFPANWAVGRRGTAVWTGTADVLSTATALSRQTEKCSQRGKVVFPDRQSAACALWEVQAAVERRAYYTKGTNEQTREVKPCRPAVGRPANAKVAEMQVLKLPRGQEDPLY